MFILTCFSIPCFTFYLQVVCHGRGGILSGGVGGMRSTGEDTAGDADQLDSRSPAKKVQGWEDQISNCKMPSRAPARSPVSPSLPKLTQQKAKFTSEGRGGPVTLAAEDSLKASVSGKGRVAGRETPEPQPAGSTKTLSESVVSKVRTFMCLQVHVLVLQPTIATGDVPGRF